MSKITVKGMVPAKKNTIKVKYPDGGKGVKTGGDTKGVGGGGPKPDNTSTTQYETEAKRAAMNYKPGSNLRGEAAAKKSAEYAKKSGEFKAKPEQERIAAVSNAKSNVSAETKASMGSSSSSDSNKKNTAYTDKVNKIKSQAKEVAEKSYDRKPAVRSLASPKEDIEEKAHGSKGIMVLKKYMKK